MHRSGIVALALLAAAAGLSAAETADPPKPDAEAPKEKLICRGERGGGIGARPKRTCLTRAQWKELDERTRKSVDEMGRSDAAACRLQGQGQMSSSCN